VPCYHPLDAWKSPSGVSFRIIPDSISIQLPCGNCIGCRLERSRQWALRLVHENRFHSSSSFITLTYSQSSLPSSGSLNLSHFQLFLKRLRSSVSPLRIRFFHSGEYGEKFGRPHYHAIIFGLDFFDSRVDVQVSPRGDTTWSSPQLSELWPHGLNRVGAVTFESCAYVARYVCKKVNGQRKQAHYERVLPSGEIVDLKPEYATMSRRPGIGYPHLEKYLGDIFPSDECVSRGFPSKPPKFYLRSLEKLDPALYRLVKDNRECALSIAPKFDLTRDRLEVREAVKQAQIGSLKRNYEIG